MKLQLIMLADYEDDRLEKRASMILKEVRTAAEARYSSQR